MLIRMQHRVLNKILYIIIGRIFRITKEEKRLEHMSWLHMIPNHFFQAVLPVLKEEFHHL